ncbi:RNA polymerase-binding transcription factor [Vibrio phage 2.275.O._10N.286.54.E11]|nr:RNA polymerase-binding transcription factor [Vibrio phage 2.275.O._10N.286.54.E11]
MAVGWGSENSANEEMEARINVGLAKIRKQKNTESKAFCDDCDAVIPEARRKAAPGCSLCINCQTELEG